MSTRRETAAESLNRGCECAVVDVAAIRRRLDIVGTHPHLFSEIPVFITPAHLADMRRAIEAIENVVRSPAWQREVLATAPDIARLPTPHHGVFFGYDFHVSAHGPRLIEINTNAGGAFLNIAARDSQIACCDTATAYLERLPGGAQLEDRVVGMFREEWRLARGAAPLRSIAIVDDEPAAQFLYPEFLLAQQVFESRGIATRIADTSALERVGDRIAIAGDPVDLIYNRSTDFYFESARSAVLREALERDLAVVTPGPREHALYANKRNLVLLSDGERLARLGASAGDREILRRVVPVTREVKGDDAGWWKARKDWFFKPQSGFGSRGTYRGDKLTRRAFTDVMNGAYIAQEFTPAGERLQMKADIRCYAYDGAIQLMAARLYQGQTTNFRTAGGGFAPVYVTT